jgi:hypothetical protein
MYEVYKAFLLDSKRLIAFSHLNFEVTIKKALRQSLKIIRQNLVAIKRDPEGK